MKHARRQAREVALQALYAWQLSGADPLEEARSNEAYEKTEFLERVAARELPGIERLQRDLARVPPSVLHGAAT